MYHPKKAWFSMNNFTAEPGEKCCVCGKEIRLIGKGRRVQFRGCPDWDRSQSGICSECYALGSTNDMLRVIMIEAMYRNMKWIKPTVPKKKGVGPPSTWDVLGGDIWRATSPTVAEAQATISQYVYGANYGRPAPVPREQVRARADQQWRINYSDGRPTYVRQDIEVQPQQAVYCDSDGRIIVNTNIALNT